MGKVRDIDHGYKALVERVYGTASTPVITVGIFESAGSEVHADGTTVLQTAIWNEFGTATIPERSFIRAWFDENEAKCREAMGRMMLAVIAGKYTKEQAVELAAQKFVGEIQRRMAQGIPPPNAPSTIEAKGSDKPLINTGQMRSAVTYKVE